MKKIVPYLSLVILAIILGGALFSKKSSDKKVLSSEPVNLPKYHEYFWKEGCLHCKNVQDFLDSWEKKDSLKIEKKEVWKNADNARLMSERAKYCNLDANNFGVPFFFTPDGKCIIGDEPIIEYLKSL